MGLTDDFPTEFSVQSNFGSSLEEPEDGFGGNVLIAEAPRSKGNEDVFDILRAISLAVSRG
jgi:hypothetical protein